MNDNQLQQLLQAINTLQDLGKVAYFNKGAYNSETTYEINDVVTYQGSSYVSLGNNNQGNLPTNATYWSVVALKGDKGDTGKPFVIEKTYISIQEMVADYDNMNVNDYVMISGSIEDEQNATLWTKTETPAPTYKWVYLADFSGASGITGQTPNIQIGNVTEGNEPAVTRRQGSTNENPILDFVLKTGATGDTGATGNGISQVSKTSTSGLTDTYTIEYTSGNSTTFDVTNGKGITSIAKTGTSGLVDTYTITYNDGTTSTFTITNGEDGEVTQAQLDETNNQVAKANMVYNALPKVSDEGDNLTLDGTANCPMKMELKGNTEQTTYTGKDLFDNVYGQAENVYTTNINANSPLMNVNCYPINLLPNTQYTLKVDMNGYQKTGEWIAGICFENGNIISLLQLNSMADITTTTFTTDSTGVVYVGQRYGFTYGTTGRMDVFLQTAKIQLEEGSTATPYEPYVGGTPSPNPDYPQDVRVVTGNNTIIVSNSDNTQSQTYPINLGTMELCKIPNTSYQDIIFHAINGDSFYDTLDNATKQTLTSGKWYKHSEIGKVVLDGSESWNKTNNAFITNVNTTPNKGNRELNSYSNYFIHQYYQSGITSNIKNGEFGWNEDLQLVIRNDNCSTANDFKTWLSTHNTIVYYVLATPTNTEITDTTLISQLNAIENAVSYDTQTNIVQENYSEPFIINAECVRSLKDIFELIGNS